MVLRATSATSAKYTINIFLYRSSKFFESTAQEGKVMGNRANLIRNAKNAKKGEKQKGEETLTRVVIIYIYIYTIIISGRDFINK